MCLGPGRMPPPATPPPPRDLLTPLPARLGPGPYARGHGQVLASSCPFPGGDPASRHMGHLVRY